MSEACMHADSLRSKRFQSSYCAKLIPFFFLLSSQLSRRTRAETLATQASMQTDVLSEFFFQMLSESNPDC